MEDAQAIINTIVIKPISKYGA